MLSTAALVAKTRGKMDLKNLHIGACFGFCSPGGDAYTNKIKHTIHYLCIPKNSPNAEDCTTKLFGKTVALPGDVDISVGNEKSLTEEECDLWLALLSEAGFPFQVLAKDVVNGVPAYYIEASTEDHLGWYGLTLSTLTLLRYIAEYPECVLAAKELKEKFPDMSAWFIVMTAIRTCSTVADTRKLFCVHYKQTSGHSLISRVGFDYPKSMMEAVDTFLDKVAKNFSCWNVNNTFNGLGASSYELFPVSNVKQKENGELYV